MFGASLAIGLALNRRHGGFLDRLFVLLTPISAAPAWVFGILLSVFFLRFFGFSPEGTFDAWQPDTEDSPLKKGKLIITIMPGGPYLLKGPVIIKDQFGKVRYTGTSVALCSCGRSKRKPICDGSHEK